MKKGLLTAGVLLVSLGVFAGTMTVAGAAVRYPAQNTVVTVKSTEITTQQREPIDFPYAIEGTPLTAERMVVYEGPRLEEGSDEPIVNGLALLLYNTGQQEILSAKIQLQTDGSTYCFTGSYVPAQSRVLLLEKSNALWVEETYTGCTGTVTFAADAGFSNEEITVEEIGMGEVSVTNLTQDKLTDVQIFHKNCLCEADLYVGGITYRTEIGDLDPNQTVSVPLDHYASGYSQIVRLEGKRKE